MFALLTMQTRNFQERERKRKRTCAFGRCRTCKAHRTRMERSSSSSSLRARESKRGSNQRGASSHLIDSQTCPWDESRSGAEISRTQQTVQTAALRPQKEGTTYLRVPVWPPERIRAARKLKSPSAGRHSLFRAQPSASFGLFRSLSLSSSD